MSALPSEQKACIECMDVMGGIYSYTIRNTCSACGGHALTNHPKRDSIQGGRGVKKING